MKISHDIHTHNLFSACCHDGNATVLNYMRREAELGNRVFGLSNHVWDERVNGASKWYRHQSIAHAEEAKYAFREAPAGLKVLFGAETEFFACRNLLGMSLEGAKHFDYLLVPHSHVHFRNDVMADFPEIAAAREQLLRELLQQHPELKPEALRAAIWGLKEQELEPMCTGTRCDRQQYVADEMVKSFLQLMAHGELIAISKCVPTVIAHPFGPVGFDGKTRAEIVSRISDEAFEQCFTAASRLGVAMELSTSSILLLGEDLEQNPLIRAFRIARRCGCRFTCGTDAHSLCKLETIREADRICEAVGVTENELADFVKG